MPLETLGLLKYSQHFRVNDRGIPTPEMYSGSKILSKEWWLSSSYLQDWLFSPLSNYPVLFTFFNLDTTERLLH